MQIPKDRCAHAQKRMIAMDSYVRIFDTTLRDGEQMPGVNLNTEEKVQIARQLDKLGVDVIEAGFPIASQGDFEAVCAVSRSVERAGVCALARMTQKDIDRAWEAIRHARKPRLHVLGAASDLHLTYKLHITREQALEMTQKWVAYAASLCPDVEFSPEDATRSDREYLLRVFNTAIDAGATTINIPDTVGYTAPSEFESLVRYIAQNIHNREKVTISVHCHDDLGLAVANSLSGVMGGARQVECTVNGFGERTGNAALEEIVMAVKMRGECFGGVRTGIDTTAIARASALTAQLCGVKLQPNKAIVGENAFRHQSGIHQHAMLQNPLTYQILRPEDVGFRESALVLGKLSGKHAFAERLRELGYIVSEEKLAEYFTQFKALADKKKEVTDSDLEAIVRQKSTMPEVFELEYFHVISGNTLLSTATVRLRRDDQVLEEAACGDGPVAATFLAIERATGMALKLRRYSIHALTGGEDSLGEAVVRMEGARGLVMGSGVSTDVVEASARAYLSAINRYLYTFAQEDQA